MRFFTGLIFLILAGWSSAQDAPQDLFALINENDLPGIEMALDAGADPDQRQTGGLEATPLMWATGGAGPEILEALLSAGANVNAVDLMGDPAINWAAYYGNVPVIELLLNAEADTSLTGHGNAAQIVMRRGHQDALRVLMTHRSDEFSRSDDEIALELALTNGDLQTILRLAMSIDLLTARDFAGRPVIQSAARAGQAVSIYTLVTAGYPVDVSDSIGFTALFEAARDGHAEAVAALLAAGADPDRVSEPSALSLTPLHLAAIGGDADSVRLLIEAGASLDQQGRIGGTPLMWAAIEGSREAAQILLEAGADAAIDLTDGTSFIDIAQQREWNDLVAMAEGG